MTIQEMHIRFDIALDKESSGATPDIPHEHRDYYLNLACERFIKQRYGSSNIKGTGFEETQKRTDDLYNLVTYVNIIPEDGDFPTPRNITNYSVSLPADYWFSVSEFVEIKPKACSTISIEPVDRAEHGSIGVRFKDPFNRPVDYKTFRVINSIGNPISSNFISLFTDSDSIIYRYLLGYIRQYPKLRAVTRFNKNDVANPLYNANPPFTYQTIQKGLTSVTVAGVGVNLPYWNDIEFWMNQQCHQEIIDIAVASALEILNNPRLQTFTQTQLLTNE